MGLPELTGHDHRLYDALDVLSKESYDEGQNVLLSVVVVREEDGIPGAGFFFLAREVLSAYPVETTDEEVFATELAKVHGSYGR